MKVIDETLLEEFRHRSRCENCGILSRGRLDAHHIYARGMGGGGRLDVRENLIALCALCHRRVHDGNIKRLQLLTVVARREGLQVEEVAQRVMDLRRKKKTPPV